MTSQDEKYVKCYHAVEKDKWDSFEEYYNETFGK